MNADGSNPTQLTATDARTSDEEPSVSPDGTRIAFASNRGDTLFGTFDVYVMGADGGNGTRLTSDGAYAYPTAAESRQPVWSPDGRIDSTVSATAFRNWVMNADGSNPSTSATWFKTFGGIKRRACVRYSEIDTGCGAAGSRSVVPASIKSEPGEQGDEEPIEGTATAATTVSTTIATTVSTTTAARRVVVGDCHSRSRRTQSRSG
jgi:hypothetical protein